MSHRYRYGVRNIAAWRCGPDVLKQVHRILQTAKRTALPAPRAGRQARETRAPHRAAGVAMRASHASHWPGEPGSVQRRSALFRAAHVARTAAHSHPHRRHIPRQHTSRIRERIPLFAGASSNPIHGQYCSLTEQNIQKIIHSLSAQRAFLNMPKIPKNLFHAIGSVTQHINETRAPLRSVQTARERSAPLPKAPKTASEGQRSGFPNSAPAS